MRSPQNGKKGPTKPGKSKNLPAYSKIPSPQSSEMPGEWPNIDGENQRCNVSGNGAEKKIICYYKKTIYGPDGQETIWIRKSWTINQESSSDFDLWNEKKED
ncbi:unnamed protein product [Anisakis simplex]|uniref:Transposase n=1 Tax=Anisakis simplex TaxID=6269 RepID=A0A0M3JJ86_ANISI|nr:unnamed protein product [Anisakis simplex]